MVGITLRAGQPGVDRQPVLGGDVSDDGIAVADRLARVDDVGQLAARRRRRVENMLVQEWHAGELEEREHLEAVAVVVGDAEQRGVGVKRQHRSSAKRGPLAHPSRLLVRWI